jgi:hypothetical protein
MNQFHNNQIVEIKQEYLGILLNTLTPRFYEGFKSVYDYALGLDKNYVSSETNKNYCLNVLKLFQLSLKDVQNLSGEKLEKEVDRIKQKSKTGDYLSVLIKAVIKSYIIMLSNSFDESEMREYYEFVSLTDFVQQCYIEIAKLFYNEPELFWHNQNNYELKKSKNECMKVISLGVKNSIHHFLPMNQILKQFVETDYSLLKHPEINQNLTHKTDDTHDEENLNNFQEIDEIDESSEEDLNIIPIQETKDDDNVVNESSESSESDNRSHQEFVNVLKDNKKFNEKFKINSDFFERSENQSEQSNQSNQSDQSNRQSEQSLHSEQFKSDSDSEDISFYMKKNRPNPDEECEEESPNNILMTNDSIHASQSDKQH